MGDTWRSRRRSTGQEARAEVHADRDQDQDRNQDQDQGHVHGRAARGRAAVGAAIRKTTIKIVSLSASSCGRSTEIYSMRRLTSLEASRIAVSSRTSASRTSHLIPMLMPSERCTI